MCFFVPTISIFRSMFSDLPLCGMASVYAASAKSSQLLRSLSSRWVRRPYREISSQGKDNQRKKRAKVLREHYSEANNPNKLKVGVTSEVEPPSETLYGHHPVLAALRASKRTFEEVFLRVSLMKELSAPDSADPSSPQINRELFGLLKERKIPIIPTNKSKLDSLALYAIHQGICATVSPYILHNFSKEQLDNANFVKPQLWMLIDEVKDPMNLGSLIRNSAYFGVDKIIITDRCSRLSPVVSKASSGAMEFFDICKSDDIETLLRSMRNRNWKIVGTTCDPQRSTASLNQFKNDNQQNMLLIMGSEGDGINEAFENYCSHFLTIPSSPRCPSTLDSLNTGVASGIILYNLSLLMNKSNPS